LAATYEIGRVGRLRFAWAPAQDPLTGDEYSFVEHASEELVTDPHLFRRMTLRLGHPSMRILWRGRALLSALPVRVRCRYVSRRARLLGTVPGVRIAPPADAAARRYVVERLADAFTAGYSPFGPVPGRDQIRARAAQLLAGGRHRSLVAHDGTGGIAAHVTWTNDEDPVLEVGYVDIIDTWTEETWHRRNLTETMIDAAAVAAGRALLVGNVTWGPTAPATVARLIRGGWEPLGVVAEHVHS
jgi:hypothetical protein